MEKLTLSNAQFQQMLINDEDYKELSLEQLEEKVNKGAEIVYKNGGFANLDTKLDELGMINVAAFINFRLAKEDLGEFVEEIDN